MEDTGKRLAFGRDDDDGEVVDTLDDWKKTKYPRTPRQRSGVVILEKKPRKWRLELPLMVSVARLVSDGKHSWHQDELLRQLRGGLAPVLGLAQARASRSIRNWIGPSAGAGVARTVGEILAPAFGTNEFVLQKVACAIEVKLHTTPTKSSDDLDRLQRKHGISEQMMQDLKTQLPHEWASTHDNGADLRLVSLNLQGSTKCDRQSKGHLRQLIGRRGHVLVEEAARGVARAHRGAHRRRAWQRMGHDT